MNQLTLSQAAAMMGATHRGADVSFSMVGSDTRSLSQGALFVALQGPNFDGHDYIDEAKKRGAGAFMVSRPTDPGLPQLQVKDTRLGLGRLAKVWRKRFPVPLLAVTGSNGKTTTKEMLAAILSRKGKVLATQGNLNNEIGLPLTLLRLQDEQYVVLEMGANRAGEIAWLSEIAEPDVAVITNAGPAHLEGFGDLQGVAKAKGELISGLTSEGVAVLNADDPQMGLWRELAGSRRVITFGIEHPADVTVGPQPIETVWDRSGFHNRCRVDTPEGSFDIELRLAGRHNLQNALAAIAAAQVVGATAEEIQQGLASLRTVKGRLQSLPGWQGCRLIDDSYNANPASVRAAIDVLATAVGRQWLILGDLAELGPAAESELHAIGQYATAKGIDRLWSLGGLSQSAAEAFSGNARHFHDLSMLIEAVKSEVVAGDTLLVKGSRGAGMERVVEALAEGEAR